MILRRGGTFDIMEFDDSLNNSHCRWFVDMKSNAKLIAVSLDICLSKTMRSQDGAIKICVFADTNMTRHMLLNFL